VGDLRPSSPSASYLIVDGPRTTPTWRPRCSKPAVGNSGSRRSDCGGGAPCRGSAPRPTCPCWARLRSCGSGGRANIARRHSFPVPPCAIAQIALNPHQFCGYVDWVHWRHTWVEWPVRLSREDDVLGTHSFPPSPGARFAVGDSRHFVPAQLAPAQDHLLAALPQQECQRLLPDLEPCPLPLGWIIHDAGKAW